MIRIDKYATHLPVLAHIVGRIEISSILEIGGGPYSTPLLAAYSRLVGAKHLVLETDPAAAEAITRLCPGVEVELLADPAFLPEHVTTGNWSLVLIDGTPGEVRVPQALELMERADLIVLHDSEPQAEPLYRYSTIAGHWKYRHDYTILTPHTMSLTNSETIWQTIKWPQTETT